MTTHISVAGPLALVFGLAFVGSCTTDPPLTNGCPRVFPNENCTTAVNRADDLSFLTPGVVHSGWNGRNDYRAVLVGNFGQFEVVSENVNVACIARLNCPDALQQDVIALLTTRGPGSTTVTVESGVYVGEPGSCTVNGDCANNGECKEGQCFEGYTFDVPVEVASYTPAEYDLGQQRYNSPDQENTTTRRACGSCHLGQGGAPHSPLSLARYTDLQLTTAASTSVYPGTCENDDGDLCNCTPVGENCNACSEVCSYNGGQVLSLANFGGGPGDHIFDLTPSEEVGIMAFMRAIDPEGI